MSIEFMVWQSLCYIPMIIAMYIIYNGLVRNRLVSVSKIITIGVVGIILVIPSTTPLSNNLFVGLSLFLPIIAYILILVSLKKADLVKLSTWIFAIVCIIQIIGYIQYKAPIAYLTLPVVTLIFTAYTIIKINTNSKRKIT